MSAVAEQRIPPSGLTLESNNDSAVCTSATKLVLSGPGIAHRRGGYRDPGSRAFTEPQLRYPKERCMWHNQFETLDRARAVIGAYIDHYHDWPDRRLAHRTPAKSHKLGTTQPDNYQTSGEPQAA